MVRTRGIEGYKSKLLSSKRLQPADRKKLIDKIQQNRPPRAPPSRRPLVLQFILQGWKQKQKKIKNVLTLKKIKLAWSLSIALSSRGQEKETIYSNAIWRGPGDRV